MTPRFLTSFLIPAALVVATAAAAAVPRTLQFRGRVSDADGWPVARATIAVSGGQRVTGRADPDGRFALAVPIGALEALARGPLRLELTASAPGRRIVTPVGAEALVLELSLVPSPSGVPRLRVRASEFGPAVAVAHAMSLDDGRGAQVTLHFVAAPEARPAGELVAEDVVEVRGIPLEPVPVAAPADDAPRATGGAPRREPPAARAPAAPPAARTPPPRATNARAEAKARERAVKDSLARRQAGERSARAAQSRLERRGAVGADRREAAARDSARRADEARLAAERARPSRGGSAARLAAEERLRRTTASARTGGAAAMTSEAVAESAAAQAARREPAPPARAAAKPGGVRRIEGGGIPPRAAARDGAEPGSSTRVWAGRAVEAEASPTPDRDACACRIEGTVEIRAERPLADAAVVEVRLAGLDAPRDTVRLAMGAPRAFRLAPVPCGVQRLEFRTLSRHRLTFLSREVLEPFECQLGHRIQPRAVLRPR